MSKRRWAAIYALLWLPFVVLYGSVLVVQSAGAMSPLVAVWGAVEALAPALLAGVGIWWLAGRLPWNAERAVRFVLVHAALGLAFSGVWTWWVYHDITRHAPELIDRMGRFILPWQALSALFLYGLMAGVANGVRMSQRERDLRVLAERAERLRAQAELAALRAHINPHFLFNTLHTVTQLLHGDPARAEAALERVSELFRYVLRLDRHGVEVVPLDEEWQFVQSYLWLEQLRMGDRLRVVSDLDDDALACSVPPFTLQPLVENAVRHGLAPKVAGGTLWVRAHERDGRLEIDVEDDGVGPVAAEGGGAGLGVRAVTQRIEARHGRAATSQSGARAGGGFRASVSLPAEAAPVLAGRG